MSQTIPCPGCGRRNPPDSRHCESCNFPLVPLAMPSAAESPAESVPQLLRRPRPRRPRPASNQTLSLWLLFGSICALVVIYIAFKANVDRTTPTPAPVEGANVDQQKRAEEFHAALLQDSTNVDAHVGLGNLLFDTGNWTHAMEHYNAALRYDSTRVHVIVDLGVCHFNLGHADEAERLFNLALKRDPKQPVALFNLGIVNETRKNPRAALAYFQRALDSGVSEDMARAIRAAIQRVQGGAAP